MAGGERYVVAVALIGSAALLLFATAGQIRAQTAVPGPPADDAPGRCARLVGKSVAGAEIDRAELLPAGARLAPFPAPLTTAICRVDARAGNRDRWWMRSMPICGRSSAAADGC